MTAPDVTELVERWFPLAEGVARKWGARFPWLRDDFVSVACEALWKIAQSHGGAGLATFPGLVRMAARYAILRRLRQERVHNPVAFQDPPATSDPETGEPRELVALLADDSPEVGSELETADEVAALFGRAGLTERQREAFIRVVGDGEDRAAVAAEQGVSAGRVGQVVTAAREKLRAAVG